MAFRNPIIPGFNPDPSIVRVGDDYFLTTSTFEYFPGLPVYHSKDLIDWKLINHAMGNKDDHKMRTIEAGGGLYAPTIRYHQGRWYVTCCCNFRNRIWSGRDGIVAPRGFIVSTDNIFDRKSWSKPVYLDVTGIDQDLFFDDDGKTYLSFTTMIFDTGIPDVHMAFGSYVVEIDLPTAHLLARPTLLRISPFAPHVAEGPHIFKKEGVYYVILAEGGTEAKHQQWVYRSTVGPLGPWETGPEGTVNPMVYNADHPTVQQTGHMDLVEGKNGQWWSVFLAVRPQHDGEQSVLSQLGRETFLAPVEWVDGWPIVNGRKPIEEQGDASLGLQRIPAEHRFDYSFESDTNDLPLGWYHLRTPVKVEHDLLSRPGSLGLRGGPFTLADDECPTLVLQKQIAFVGVWQATVDFTPGVGEEAGTTVFWSKWSCASLGVRGTAEGREMVFRYPDPDGDDFKTTVHALPSSGPVELKVVASPTLYTFSFGQGTWTEIGSIHSKLLVRTRPFDSIFTGTHLGLYSQGTHGFGCLDTAWFSNVSWEGRYSGGD